MRNIFLTSLISFFSLLATAQEKEIDTVKVSLAKTSQIIFTIKDRSDLAILKHYDFKNLFQDIITKLEQNDTTIVIESDTASVAVKKEDHDSCDSVWYKRLNHRKKNGRTSQSLNLDLGMNNFISDGKFPDSDNESYSVRPWGSWYVGISSIQRSRLTKKLFLEWGVGVSWYNFKFQNDNLLIQKDVDGLVFIDDPRSIDPGVNFTKSKLTATFINASLIPVIDFGDYNNNKSMWDEHSDSFRIGFGPYVGYRISSYTKQVYTEDGDDRKDHDKDNFYLNNFRYGARLQIGFRSTDLFFNYDMNKLFATNKGPDLNAFSFGVIF